MSDYATEEIFLKEILLKDEVEIEEGHDIDVVVKEENEETRELAPCRFKCEVCSKTLLTLSQLNKHALTHKKRKTLKCEKDHKCKECGNSFVSAQALKIHNNAMHPVETPFKCEVCPKEFRTFWKLRQHSIKHSQVKSYNCDLCSSVYKYQRNLAYHKTIHHDNEGKFPVSLKVGNHKCNECGKYFVSQHTLSRHIVNSHFIEVPLNFEVGSKINEERLYKCDQCPSSYKYKGNFDKHQHLQHRKESNQNFTETPFQCEVCPKSFSTWSFLKNHAVYHNQENPFKCDRCSVAFKSKSNLDRHNALVHLNEARLACSECGKKFLFPSTLKQHMVRHTKDRNHKCITCGKAFKNKESMVYHFNRSHPAQTSFQCEVCSKFFSTLSLLEEHSVSHDDAKLFKCDQCSVEFKTQLLLRQHGVRYHGEKPYQCEKCGKQFKSMCNLRAHLATHDTGLNFGCEECDTRFKTRHSLTVHKYRYHSALKPRQREVRSKRVKTPRKLKRHSVKRSEGKTAHVANRPFQCEQCDRNFNNIYHLKLHKVTHTEDRPFQCDSCPRTFKSDVSIRKHLKFVHGIANTPSANNYSCHKCSKKFKAPSKLKEHLVTHSDEKNFKCDLCAKAFKRAKDLSLHVIKLHQCNTAQGADKPFRCEYCFWKCGSSHHLRKHLITHSEAAHKARRRGFSCGSCSRKFRLKASLDKHVKDEHEVEGVETEVKVEPTEIYDPEGRRDLSSVLEVKNEPEHVDIKREPEDV